MANEIKYLHDDGAETVYAIVRDMADEWYVAATAEAFDDTHWATYDITLTNEDATYNTVAIGTFPAVAAGYYWIDVYLQATGTPAKTDHRLASRLVYWDGTALTPAAAVDGVGIIDSTGGTVTMAKAVEALLAFAGGKCSYNAATGIATYYGQDGETVILTTPLLGGGDRDEPTIT